MTYQVLTCPNCNGTGCPTCKSTGKVRVAEDQLKQLKQMVSQAAPAPQPFTPPQTITQPQNPPTSLKKLKLTTNLAGIIAFSFLSLLAGAAAASWYFLKTLKPFFSAFIALITLAATRLAWQHPFFQPQEPNDFLAATKKT